MPLEAPSAQSEKITAQVLKKKGLQIYKPPVIRNAPTIYTPTRETQGTGGLSLGARRRVEEMPPEALPERGTFAYGLRNAVLLGREFGKILGPPVPAIGQISYQIAKRIAPTPPSAEGRTLAQQAAFLAGRAPKPAAVAPATPAAGYAQYVPATAEAARIARERTEGRYGLAGTLTQAQLAYASKLTGEAIFGFDPLERGFAPGVDRRPLDISTDVALQLPFGLDSPTYHKSDYFKQAFMDAFNVEGFANVQEFLTALGYKEVPGEPGRWHRQDQAAPISGYGGGGGGGGGPIVIPSGGASGSRAGPVGSPGGLVQWRIGL